MRAEFSDIQLTIGGTITIGNIPDYTIAASDLASIGHVVQFFSPPPSTRWLPCDGRSISKADGIRFYNLYKTFNSSLEDWDNGVLVTLPTSYVFDEANQILTLNTLPMSYIGY